MNTLIVTPMQQELDSFLQGCTGRGFRPDRSEVGRLPVVRIPALGVSLACGGTGKA